MQHGWLRAGRAGARFSRHFTSGKDFWNKVSLMNDPTSVAAKNWAEKRIAKKKEATADPLWASLLEEERGADVKADAKIVAKAAAVKALAKDAARSYVKADAKAGVKVPVERELVKDQTTNPLWDSLMERRREDDTRSTNRASGDPLWASLLEEERDVDTKGTETKVGRDVAKTVSEADADTFWNSFLEDESESDVKAAHRVSGKAKDYFVGAVADTASTENKVGRDAPNVWEDCIQVQSEADAKAAHTVSDSFVGDIANSDLTTATEKDVGRVFEEEAAAPLRTSYLRTMGELRKGHRTVRRQMAEENAKSVVVNTDAQAEAEAEADAILDAKNDAKVDAQDYAKRVAGSRVRRTVKDAAKAAAMAYVNAAEKAAANLRTLSWNEDAAKHYTEAYKKAYVLAFVVEYVLPFARTAPLYATCYAKAFPHYATGFVKAFENDDGRAIAENGVFEEEAAARLRTFYVRTMGKLRKGHRKVRRQMAEENAKSAVVNTDAQVEVEADAKNDAKMDAQDDAKRVAGSRVRRTAKDEAKVAALAYVNAAEKAAANLRTLCWNGDDAKHYTEAYKKAYVLAFVVEYVLPFARTAPLYATCYAKAFPHYATGFVKAFENGDGRAIAEAAMQESLVKEVAMSAKMNTDAQAEAEADAILGAKNDAKVDAQDYVKRVAGSRVRRTAKDNAKVAALAYVNAAEKAAANLRTLSWNEDAAKHYTEAYKKAYVLAFVDEYGRAIAENKVRRDTPNVWEDCIQVQSEADAKSAKMNTDAQAEAEADAILGAKNDAKMDAQDDAKRVAGSRLWRTVKDEAKVAAMAYVNAAEKAAANLRTLCWNGDDAKHYTEAYKKAYVLAFVVEYVLPFARTAAADTDGYAKAFPHYATGFVKAFENDDGRAIAEAAMQEADRYDRRAELCRELEKAQSVFRMKSIAYKKAFGASRKAIRALKHAQRLDETRTMPESEVTDDRRRAKETVKSAKADVKAALNDLEKAVLAQTILKSSVKAVTKATVTAVSGKAKDSFVGAVADTASTENKVGRGAPSVWEADADTLWDCIQVQSEADAKAAHTVSDSFVGDIANSDLTTATEKDVGRVFEEEAAAPLRTSYLRTMGELRNRFCEGFRGG